MLPHPGREYAIFRTEHAKALCDSERRRLVLVLHPNLRYHMRCVLCGLGHRLVRWGTYLEDQFELTPDPYGVDRHQPSHG